MDKSIFEGVHCYLTWPQLDGCEDSDRNKDNNLWMDNKDSGDEEMDTLPLAGTYEGDLDPVMSMSTLLEPTFKAL